MRVFRRIAGGSQKTTQVSGQTRKSACAATCQRFYVIFSQNRLFFFGHFSVIGLKELPDENVSFSRTVVDEQVRRNGLLAGCLASMVTQGMGQRIKTNVTETHVVTDVHVDKVNSAMMFYFTGYIF